MIYIQEDVCLVKNALDRRQGVLAEAARSQRGRAVRHAVHLQLAVRVIATLLGRKLVHSHSLLLLLLLLLDCCDLLVGGGYAALPFVFPEGGRLPAALHDTARRSELGGVVGAHGAQIYRI